MQSPLSRGSCISLPNFASALKRCAEGGLPVLAGGKTGGSSALAPLLAIGLGTGQGVPRLNADKAHRLCRSRPDEGVGVALHIADDPLAGVLFVDAQCAAAQTGHAEAVVLASVKYYITKLKEKNYLKRQGSSQKGKWVILTKRD